jgi:intein/homing endonuclease
MNSKSNEFKFNKSVEVFDKWGCSSVRLSLDEAKESNRLKSDESGADACESLQPLNSNLLNPTIFLPTKKIRYSYNDRKRKINIPDILNASLAEDIGIQIGDGSVPMQIDKKGIQHYVIACYGNITEDRQYLRNFVIPLKKKLFNINLNLKDHPAAGTCYIKFESKAVFSFYEKIIILNIGKKNEIVIPKIILQAPLKIQLACIRGIADTDFSLSFKKNTKGFHNDPCISLGCSSKQLVLQIARILKKIKITTSLTLDNEEYDERTKKTYVRNYLYINGKKNLGKWMSSIAFHNSVQTSRYLVWKRFGFCPPKTTLKQRISILKGEITPEILAY